MFDLNSHHLKVSNLFTGRPRHFYRETMTPERRSSLFLFLLLNLELYDPNFVAAALLSFPTGKVSPAKATWAASKTWKYPDRPLIYSEIPMA